MTHKPYSGFASRSMVRGFSSNFFVKYHKEKYTYKFYASLLQNGYDGLALGGYAIQDITNKEKNIRKYTTLNSANFWTEIYSNGRPFEVGLFSGYTKNLGSLQEIKELSSIDSFSRGSNIAYLYRVSPRLVYRNYNLKIGGEIEYTSAAYGNGLSDHAVPKNPDTISNIRFLVAVTYEF